MGIKRKRPESKVPKNHAAFAFMAGDKPINENVPWKEFVDWMHKQKMITFKERMKWRRLKK